MFFFCLFLLLYKKFKFKFIQFFQNICIKQGIKKGKEKRTERRKKEDWKKSEKTNDS